MQTPRKGHRRALYVTHFQARGGLRRCSPYLSLVKAHPDTGSIADICLILCFLIHKYSRHGFRSHVATGTARPLFHRFPELTMPMIRPRSVIAAGALALLSISAFAQMTPGPRDPYTQGGATASGTYDPNTSGARAGDKFDPYSQGADSSTRQNLAPQQQTYQSPAPSYQPAPTAAMAPDSVGASAYRGDMRWSGPMLGSRLGPRNRFLDGA